MKKKPTYWPKDKMNYYTREGLSIKYRLRSAKWDEKRGVWDCTYEAVYSYPSQYERYSIVISG